MSRSTIRKENCTMSSFENYTGRYHGMEIEAVEGFFGSYQFTGKSFLFLNKIIAKKKKIP